MSRFGRPILVLAGAAEGLGASVAKMFAAAGHDVLGLARSDRATARLTELVGEAGGEYAHLTCDVTKPAQVADALLPHADRIAVLVHNAHTLLIKPFEETSSAEFEEVWRVACLGAFVAAGAVLPHMRTRHAGTIILSGATAARRGGANFAAFASAKFALRGLAQSMSREFGPHGVHVAHVVIDGLIDAPQSDRRFGQAQSARMDPDAVARAYLALATQHPSAWTHELDLRPFSGRF
jgi:NAD(P)-dependent dehydrogenase (short-subunit alcohol dehydrogenase family)